jgi:hypothetical protein
MEVAPMSLSAHEQRTVDAIEHRLSGSDPDLASLLSMFSRLTAGEEMPAREKIRAGWQRLSWERAELLLGILIGLALIAVAVAMAASGSGSGGGRRACAVWAAACAGHATVRSATQRPDWLAVWLPGCYAAACSGPDPGPAAERGTAGAGRVISGSPSAPNPLATPGRGR